MPVKLIAIDLDDTLLRSDGSICPESAARLREAHQEGVCVVIATSRPLYFVRRVTADLGITDNPVICADGALIMSHPSGEIWQEHTIPHDIATAITSHADENNGELTMVVKGKTFYRQRPGQKIGMMEEGRYVVQSNQAMIEDGDPIRLLIHDSETIRDVASYIEERGYTSQVTIQYYYDLDGEIRSMGVFLQSASKGNALAYVCNRLGISLEETLAIGDGNNDISMFKVAGISVAMGNALEDIKQQADFITASNDACGVAEAIQKYVL